MRRLGWKPEAPLPTAPDFPLRLPSQATNTAAATPSQGAASCLGAGSGLEEESGLEVLEVFEARLADQTCVNSAPKKRIADE